MCLQRRKTACHSNSQLLTTCMIISLRKKNSKKKEEVIKHGHIKKLKVKVTLPATTMAQRGSRGISVIFLQNDATSLRIYFLEWPGTHCTGGWKGLRPVWTGAENLVPQGFDPLKNCYTNYAVMSAIRHPKIFSGFLNSRSLILGCW